LVGRDAITCQTQGEIGRFEGSSLGEKKNTCGSGSRPTLFFSADPIIFSMGLTV
jgi:hypothetical protein